LGKAGQGWASRMILAMALRYMDLKVDIVRVSIGVIDIETSTWWNGATKYSNTKEHFNSSRRHKVIKVSRQMIP
jgi:hypothetical protein